MRYVILDGKRYEWKEVRRIRREQILANRQKKQLILFELKHDTRPPSQQTVDGRFQSPTLFSDS